ncbi:MAG TPA: hypothetical protein VHC49_20450 [Mycobacteriales bacterium]|nr:hypothetical protein [Mycobacteriales bacterium]
MPSELERAVFGRYSPLLVRQWLAEHVTARLDGTIAEVLFEAGAVGAVWGLRLADGREVVLKALRPGFDRRRLQAVVRFQNLLVEKGFPAPAVLDGPAETAGVMAVVEERLQETSTGDPHRAEARAAMATGLARQIDLLRSLDGSDLVAGRPGWANWECGAWPVPHDPVMDFSTPVPGYEWLDERANAAAAVLRAADGSAAVIGHSDWVWQNVCVHEGRFGAGYDWDSLVWAPEAAIVGLAAGAFTQGTPVPPYDPYPEEVAAFLEDYQDARRARFDAAELRTTEAAATWVRCYNARIHLDNWRNRELDPPPGCYLTQ